MVRRWLTVIVLVGGCRQIAGLDDPVPNDGRPDSPPGQFCYGTGLVQLCLSVEPSSPVTLTQPIDTNAFGCSADVISGGTGLCVIAGTTITLPSGMVVATGPKPLVLVATDSIDVMAGATLDVAGHRQSQMSTTPAGGTYASCSAGTSPMGSAGGSGGGQGGSFITRGGDGGVGAGVAAGGMAGSVLATPTTLHSGCGGHSGGGGDGGSRGSGGGAVFLIANGTITIAGRVDASGAGGSGAFDGPNSGGGGGGTGGMVGLDAPTISIAGAVCAIGGSGGGGSGTTTSGANGGGDAAGGSASCTPGTPGTGSTGSGAGGLGAVAGVGAPGASGASASGGGGGGGAGYIKIYGAHTGAGAVQPPAS